MEPLHSLPCRESPPVWFQTTSLCCAGCPISAQPHKNTDRPHSIARLADFVYAYWKNHTSKDAPQTHLSIHFRSSSDVRIDYVNLEYKNQAEQAAKDKERDATYSLKNSDDL